MSYSTADDIRTLLEAESSLGLVFATNLFVGREPATPDADNCVTLFDYASGGIDPMPAQGSEYYRTGLQVRVRNKSYTTAGALIQSIVDFLNNLGNITINDYKYTVIQCVQTPVLLDWDDRNRCRWVASFNCQKVKNN